MDPSRAAPGADIVLAAVAGEPGVHVVGGAVRDALLRPRPARARPGRRGRRGRGGPPRRGARRRHAHRARALRHRHRARAGGFAFDLAGARRRRYARPGRCPTSSSGRRIEEDLARRDFTVNAIAVSLADGAFDDWPGAREDLDAGVLRVLHERSFVDDPTRMLRLVRYAARLEFAPDAGHRGPDRPGAAGHRDRRPARQRAAAAAPRAAAARSQLLERYGLGPRAARRGLRVDWLAERAGPGLLALAAAARDRRARARRPPRPARLLAAATATSSWPRRAASSAFTDHLDGSRRRPVAPLAPRAPRDRPAAGRRGRRRRPALARPTSATAGSRSRATTWSPPGLTGAAGRRGGSARAMVALLDGRAPDREAQLRAALPPEPLTPCPRPSAGRTTRSSPTCRTRGPSSRPPRRRLRAARTPR